MRALPFLALCAACAAPDYERSRAAVEENRRLRAEKAGLEGEIRNQRFYLAEFEKRVPLSGPRAQPRAWRPGAPLTARVNAVKGDLVSLSVGAVDGAAVGQRYKVRRGGLHVGYARVENAMKRISIAHLESGGPVQVGDIAELVDG